MSTARQFNDLEVWQESINLAEIVYKVSAPPAFQTDLSFRDQIRRAAVSISSNIAEGFERGTQREFIRFLHIAKGSCAEVRSQLMLAVRLGHLNEGSLNDMIESSTQLLKRLAALVRYLEQSNSTASDSQTRNRQPVTRN